jgi:hypothetical protein
VNLGITVYGCEQAEADSFPATDASAEGHRIRLPELDTPRSTGARTAVRPGDARLTR